MKARKTFAFLRRPPLLLSALFLYSALHADEAAWDRYMRVAAAAYEREDYAEATLALEEALEEAEIFGEDDIRLVTTLSELASLHESQGQ